MKFACLSYIVVETSLVICYNPPMSFISGVGYIVYGCGCAKIFIPASHSSREYEIQVDVSKQEDINIDISSSKA